MDYTSEEIEFVRFCSKQDEKVVCRRRRKKCPASESCDENNNPLCEQLLAVMENGEELSDEHIGIIRFWRRELKWDDDCIPNGGEASCPNIEHCVEGAEACEGLLRKLGVYEPYEYDIYEEEVQKVVVNDIRKRLVDWHAEEDLEFLDEKPHIEGVGKPDILLRGVESKNLYVVELKVGEASRQDVGQLASYVGWYREHPPAGCTEVKGILLAPRFSKSAEYALKACNLEKRCYDLHIKIRPDE